MDAYLKAFWLPKDGSTEEEYEDAFFPRHSSSFTGERLRFAIADGATEAFTYSSRGMNRYRLSLDPEFLANLLVE